MEVSRHVIFIPGPDPPEFGTLCLKWTRISAIHGKIQCLVIESNTVICMISDSMCLTKVVLSKKDGQSKIWHH